jgi:hypothetical protein
MKIASAPQESSCWQPLLHTPLAPLQTFHDYPSFRSGDFAANCIVSWRPIPGAQCTRRYFLLTPLRKFRFCGRCALMIVSWRPIPGAQCTRRYLLLTPLRKFRFSGRCALMIVSWWTLLPRTCAFKILSRVGVTYKTGFGWDDWIYWHLNHTTRDYRKYSAIACLHTLQFTDPGFITDSLSLQIAHEVFLS